MSTGIKFERENFDKTLQKYLKVQRKTVAQALNHKAYNVVIRAIKHTPVADKAKIRAHLAWNKKSSKRLRAWARKHYPRLVSDQARKRFFKDMKSLRAKSVGYLKSGWITPMRALKKAAGTGGKSTIKGATQRSPSKGSAEPAKDWRKTGSYKSKVTFTNATGAQNGSGKKWILQKFSQAEAARQFGEPALKKGFTGAKADMQKYLLKKLKQAAKKSGAG